MVTVETAVRIAVLTHTEAIRGSAGNYYAPSPITPYSYAYDVYGIVPILWTKARQRACLRSDWRCVSPNKETP